jgi:quinol monooxygenase YgiN
MRRYETKVVMLAELRVRAEALDPFLDYTTANLAVSRAAPGNLVFDMLVDDADPLLVRFYEEWETAEAQRRYMAGRVAAGDLVTLLSFLAGEPRFVALRSVAA